MTSLSSIVPPLFVAISALLVLSGCRHTETHSGPIVAGELLRDTYITDIDQPEVVAWTPDLHRAVVAGQRSGKHVLVVAYRAPRSKGSIWILDEVSIMRDDGTDFWILGKAEYNYPPNRDDISALLKRLRSTPEEFVFKAGAK